MALPLLVKFGRALLILAFAVPFDAGDIKRERSLVAECLRDSRTR
jgi:hypothetical protein